ncbi:MAG: hypothetical protein LBC27_02085 [Spirochaetaceae bacterium]|jgi:hypothetical protein|nr:hypothetical protein [Spirochaetaceae bacterium]
MQQVTEPGIDGVTLEDWQTFLLRTTIQGGGYILLGVVNMDTTGAPSIELGSRLEINGAFYKAVSNESVSGSPANGTNYVYAVPSSGGAYFQYSAAAPVWNTAKGGWYNGNNRAVLRFEYANGEYNDKEIIDYGQGGGNKMSGGGSVIQNKEILSSPAGTLIKTVTPTSGLADRHFRLEKGKYCFEVAGGGGGGGGAGQRQPPSPDTSAAGDGVGGITSYVAAQDYLLAAFGGGAGGGGAVQWGPPGRGGSSQSFIDIPGVSTAENGNQISTIIASGGASGGEDGTGSGNNRNSSTGGGGAGANGVDSDPTYGPKGGEGKAGGKIIESVVIIDTTDFIALAGIGGTGEKGATGVAGGVGFPGYVKVYKM